MSSGRLNPQDLKNSYVLCICEGTAEEVILNRLLDENCLIFNRNQVIDKAPTRIRQARKIESSFLNRDFAKDVVILRIIDSRREKFNLGKLYRERFSVYDILATPEIEMLMVWGENLYEEFKKSRKKPSDFMAAVHAREEIKSRSYLERYYADVNYLLTAIENYARDASHRDELGLYQLTKRAYGIK